MPRCVVNKKDENQIKPLANKIFDEKKTNVLKENALNIPNIREALQNIQNKNNDLVLKKEILKNNKKPSPVNNPLASVEKAVKRVEIEKKPPDFVGDSIDPLQYHEYLDDVFIYLCFKEKKYVVLEAFLLQHDEITEKMRWILIDWIVQVHYRFGLTQETLFLCVNFFDRYVEKASAIRKNELQLIGITSLLLASKYEEQCVPQMRDFVYVTDYSCTGAHIRQMEVTMLNKLNFSMDAPICLQFLRRITKSCNISQPTHNVAKYFMELCLLDAWSCQFVPSFVAAACITLAIEFVGESEWNEEIRLASGYERTELLVLMKRIPYIISRNEELRLSAISSKYQQKSHGAVSNMEFLSSPEFRNFYQS